MKKQTGKIKVECLGRAASEVTQSIYQLTAGDRRIILDYGLYQSSDLVESYKVNHSGHQGDKSEENRLYPDLPREH